MNKVELIKKEGLIVIFRGVGFDKIAKTAEALYDGGVRVIEIAFNPSDENTVQKTTALIKEVKDKLGDKMTVGAGTVICEEYLEGKGILAKF